MKKKIYVIVILDRHCDPNVEIRKSLEAARLFAVKLCLKYSLDGKYEYHDYETFESYDYSPENDRILIFKREIDA